MNVTRRKFLKNSAGAAGVLFAAQALPYGALANPLGKPVGLQLYTVAADMKTDLKGTLKQVHDIGYREVETAGFAGLTAKDFRKLLDDTGLTCISCHLPFMGTDWNAQFDDAHALGAHYATSSTLLDPKAPGTNGRSALSGTMEMDGFKKMAETANKIGDAAAKNGLQYSYHNHDFEFRLFDGKPAYDTMLHMTDPKKVQFEIDCGWMVLGGFNPVDYLRKYPGRFRMLHIKDFHDSASRPSTSTQGHQGTELGRGFIDYKPIFAEAKNAGIAHYFVEQEPPFADMPALQAAKADYDYLHRLT